MSSLSIISLLANFMMRFGLLGPSVLILMIAFISIEDLGSYLRVARTLGTCDL